MQSKSHDNGTLHVNNYKNNWTNRKPNMSFISFTSAIAYYYYLYSYY
jgi:hypothetical protein